MEIKQDFIVQNEYSRPGKPLKSVMAVVMHWTGVPKQDAKEVRQFFQNRRAGTAGYGSAHYIVGLKGDIVQCIPETEIAYHCGSSQKDPASGRVYTDKARDMFGMYAKDYMNLSPNLVTIGIELCTLDDKGHFSDATLSSAVHLVADILQRYKLTAADIVTHHDIVGWKDCPRLWTHEPGEFEAFRTRVQDTIIRGYIA